MRSLIAGLRNVRKVNSANLIFRSIIKHGMRLIDGGDMLMLAGVVSIMVFVISARLSAAETIIGDWRFEDGTGSTKVKDYSGAGRNAGISNTDTIHWCREDRYGWFLQFTGDTGGVTVENMEALTSAFTFDLRFTCNFGKLDAAEVPLLCKGDSQSPDYAVLVTGQGQIVVRLRGLEPSVTVVDAKLESNRDYAVAVRFDGKELSIFKDGQLLKKIPVKGKMVLSDQPLLFGGRKGAAFTGCLYLIRIFNSALPDNQISAWSGSAKPSMPVPIAATESFRNPAATVFANFLEMEPKDALSTDKTAGKWYYRNIALFPLVSQAILHAGFDEMPPDISYNPNLKGRYNLYIGMRGVGEITEVQVKTSDMKKWATIRLPKHPNDIHINHDILWATNVPMDNQRIILHNSYFLLYLGYISFVPVDKDARRTLDSRFVQYGEMKDMAIATPASAGCTERIYKDSKPLPPLTGQSLKRGYLLWKTHWMDLVFPNSKPVKDPGSIQLECFAAKGEFEPVTFALHSLTELKNVSLVLTNSLKNNNGEAFKGEIDIRQTRYLDKRSTNFQGPGEYMRFPMYLETLCGRSVPENCTRQYWITIHVPETTPAGVYTGVLKLSADDGKTSELIPLKLTVYPFALSPLNGYNFGMYFIPGKDPSSWRDAFNDMKAHGMNSVASIATNTNIKISGSTPPFKMELDQSTLSQVIKEFQLAGLTGDYLCILDSDSIQNFCAQFPPEKAAVAYEAIFRQILAEAKNRHWPRLIFQPYDEVPSTPSDFPALIRELKLLKKAGAVTEADHLWLKTNRGTEIQKNIDQCVSFIDIFTLRYSSQPVFYVDSWEDITKRVIADKKALYTYNINNAMAISEMATMRFSTGWFFRTAGNGCTGYYLYIYQIPSGGCYNDFDGVTDWLQQYPPSKKYDTLGGPALYWEATREGIDDLKYILTLENLIERYKANPRTVAAVSNAKKLLLELKNSFDIKKMQKECVFLESKWDNTRFEKGQRIAEGRFNLPNGWTFEQYDKSRRQIADAIIKIMRASGVSPRN